MKTHFGEEDVEEMSSRMMEREHIGMMGYLIGIRRNFDSIQIT